MENKKRVWITWENQRRNRTLSKHLDAKLLQLDFNLNKFTRYPLLTLYTIYILLKERPKIIFAQNPSIVLALLCVYISFVMRTPVIIDSHYAGLFPLNKRSKILNYLSRFIAKYSTVTIVTTSELKQYVENLGGKSVVLQDPLPSFPPYTPPQTIHPYKYKVFFICTWAEDEPYLEVIKAAELIDPSIHIFITGNSKGKEKGFGGRLPNNIILTGYISEDMFIKNLYDSDVVIDLTTRENCLVCGAYESISACRPVILSDSAALREYFHKGALFTNNTAKDIANKIDESLNNIEDLVKDVKVFKAEIESNWESSLSNFDRKLTTLKR